MADSASDDIHVDAPPDTVMAVITDFDSYPDWTSQITDVEIVERDGDGRATQVRYHVDAKVLELDYTLGYRYPDDHRLTWSLVEGEQLRQLDGEYDVQPEGDGSRVTYRLTVDLTIPVPGFLKKRAAKQILETGLVELKRRAEELA